jgi:hypothetical protein
VIAALARPTVARLVRTRRAWLTSGAWCALAIAVAAAARANGAAHGADHVLVEVLGPFVLPLLAYALVGAALDARSLGASVAPLVSFGAPARRAVAAAWIVTVGACTALCAVLAAATAIVAHGAEDPPLVRDAFASAYVAALGGSAYAAWFLLGATFGRQGRGRAAFLILDWVLDRADGVLALVTPRAHLRNLLGGTPPMDVPQRASAIALVCLLGVYAFGALWRTRRGSG